MKNRWVVLFAGICIQSILGGVYAWSVFVPELIDQHGFTQGQCGAVFGVCIAVFTLAMIAGGRLLSRVGPRLTAVVGGLLFASGYWLASYSDGHYWVLLLGISGLSGAGIGFGYVCPLSVGMKWFPEHKGLITGLAVAGFGGGAIILSAVASRLLGAGMDILDLFGWIALVPGALLVVAALLLATPDSHQKMQVIQTAERSAVWTLPFALCTGAIFTGTFAGLLIIGNLTPMATGHGFDLLTAARAVSAFAVGNAGGRIFWGAAFDRIGYRSIPLSLVSLAIGLVLLPLAVSPMLFVATAVVLGFGFGANFVVYASALSRKFGVEAFARLYPVCFLGYGVAGVTGPALGGYLADHTGSYALSLEISLAMVSAVVILTWLGLKSFHAKE